MTLKVLLADDHAIVRDGLRALLEAEQDMQVIGVAGNGREAVAEALRCRPDVVVMDIAMPELDGVEATRRIHEQNSDTQILILSMYFSAEHIYRTLQAGAMGYVLKESAGEEVVEAIRTIHAGKRFLSPRITEVMIQDYLRGRVGASPLEGLSNREREVLQLVVQGQANAEIAQNLSLSPKTVETYRARILQKLGVNDTVELVKFAMRHGLIS